MLTPQPLQGGYQNFGGKGLHVRSGAVLTTSYVLCDDHNSVDGADTHVKGDIRIEDASMVTLVAAVKFGSATSIEIKPVFTDGKRAGNMAAVTDLAVATTPWKTVTSAGAGFTPDMVGSFLWITNDGAGNFMLPGIYRIVTVNSATSVTLDRACATADDTTGGGFVQSEAQECAMDTSAGSTTLTPHEFTIAAASGDGLYTLTFPAPQMPNMRLYAKCTGTATASDLQLLVFFGPAGAQ